jgi:predicted alpha/beta superfamily hydrolase
MVSGLSKRSRRDELSAGSIPATEARLVHSAVAQQDYLIWVALPFHYAEHPEKVWPVIYLLDANVYFGYQMRSSSASAIQSPAPSLRCSTK